MRKRKLTAHLLNWDVIEIDDDPELHQRGGFILHGICKAGVNRKLVEGQRIYTARIHSHSADKLQQGEVVEATGGSLYMLGQRRCGE